MDDFLRPRIQPSEGLVVRLSRLDGQGGAVPALQARFVSWSRMEIRADCVDGNVCGAPRTGVIRIVLAQAYNADWRASGCEVYGTPGGNLALECPVRQFREPLRLEYRNSWSDLAARVSSNAWKMWVCVLAALFLVQIVRRTSFRRYPPPISIG
jgi:hypothetical protein